MDETASKRGHNYIKLFVDLETPKLLFATEGRHAATLGAFREDLEAHGARAEAIEEFCLDMSPAYLKGLDQHFPMARIIFDKFHVMKLINEAVDEVRRQEQQERPELKGSRYVWMKNPEQLTVPCARALATMAVDRTTVTARPRITAYLMRPPCPKPGASRVYQDCSLACRRGVGGYCIEFRARTRQERRAAERAIGDQSGRCPWQDQAGSGTRRHDALPPSPRTSCGWSARR